MPRRNDKSRAGRYAYEGLERVMHEKARLGLLTSLAAHAEGLSFTDLKELCALTDGNLARHLQVLEEAELVEIEKQERRTLCRLSDAGRERFLEYLAELERVVRDAARATGRSKGRGAEPGFSSA
jgi:DNA-binding transcriptional ArsR family regulator